jgi:hypothetical protein
VCATGPLIDASGHNVELVRLMSYMSPPATNEDASPISKPPTPSLGGEQKIKVIEQACYGGVYLMFLFRLSCTKLWP